MIRTVWFCAIVAVALAVCPDQPNLPANPPDPAQTGPHLVGARTYQQFTGLERDFTVEVWYPATRNQAFPAQKVYDTRDHLPPRYEDAIPDGLVDQSCACYDDVQPAYEFGPFPAVVFVHGSGGYRTQAMTQVVHWASRGFVVLSADHPGITLRDALDLGNGQTTDQAGDARIMFDILRNPLNNTALAWLGGLVDPTRFGLSGQSAGAGAVAGAQDEASVLIPMSGGGTFTAGESTFVFGGDIDRVVPYASQVQSYTTSSPPKRLLGLVRSGHLGTTPDMCFVGRDDGGFIDIAIRYGIQEALLFAALYDGCTEDHLPPEGAWPPLHFAASAVLEEVLMCDATMTEKLSAIASIYPDAVYEYQEQLA